MSQRFVVMESLLTTRRTIVRRYRLFYMFTLSIRPMKIAKASLTIRLLILDTKIFSIRDLTIRTVNFFRLPLFTFSKCKLNFIFPLILLWISNHILMRKDRKFLLPRTHIDSVKLRLLRKKILNRKISLPYTWQSLRKGCFHQKHFVFSLMGILKIKIEPTSFHYQIFPQTLFDANH